MRAIVVIIANVVCQQSFQVSLVDSAPAQDSNMSGYGELCALYVDPDHWGRGIGVALVSAARARLFDLGYRTAILWVLVGNVRAERFYRRDQWTPDGGRRTEQRSKRISNLQLHFNRYGWGPERGSNWMRFALSGWTNK